MGLKAPRSTGNETAPRNAQPPKKAPALEVNAETFNLIARSLLNVSDQIPALVRDCVDLKTDNAELKGMLWQLSASVASLQTDIQTIARSVAGGVSLPRMRPGAGGPPSEQSLRETLRSIPGLNENEDR